MPVAPGSGPEAEGTNLPLPHERDEAAGHVAKRPDAIVDQAASDIEAGQVDTDMRATPALDAERRGQVVAGGERAADDRKA